MTTEQIEIPEAGEKWFKASKFVSFYSTSAEPTKFMRAEHRSENAAKKGSWQSAEMRKHWIYRGYRAF